MSQVNQALNTDKNQDFCLVKICELRIKYIQNKLESVKTSPSNVQMFI